MTTKAATEGDLGALHSKVAKVMANALSNIETAQELFEENPEAVDRPEVSAPLLGVITKFLNDNKISCVPEESEELSDLAKRLENKRQKRRQVGNVVHLVSEDE